MTQKNLAIIVGGGPAPGINAVISAATIEAINRGFTVYGIFDGFKHLSRGDLSCIKRLRYENVHAIDAKGGSILGTSKVDPTKSREMMDCVVAGLRHFQINYLVTIGGEGTATIAMDLARELGDAVSVGHVPKTIDNDVSLPPNCVTFGFETAREVGANLVKTLRVDARTTNHWYIVVTMGRNTGHLALGIGIAARATLTIIPEELTGTAISAGMLADTIVGSIVKGYALGLQSGTIVLAEGVAEKLTEDLKDELARAGRDPQGHVRLSDLNFAGLIARRVRERLRDIGITTKVHELEVGYELRCADPISYDREYCLQLGYGVVDLLANGHSHVMITRQGQALVGLPFESMYDPQTKMAKVRYVDRNSLTYRAASKYMLRLTEADLNDPAMLAKLAAVTTLTHEQIREIFLPVASRAETYALETVLGN